MATTRVQSDFRWRNDNGSEAAAGASYYAAAHANITPTVKRENLKLRLRIVVQQTGTTAATHTQRLYVAKNGGSYAQASASSTSGCKIVDSANLTDDAATTQQLSSGSFVAGKVDDVSGQCGATASMGQNVSTEHEYMLEFDYNDLQDGDYFDFKAYQTTSALNTYTYVPRITITKYKYPACSLMDNFDDNAQDLGKWVYGAINGATIEESGGCIVMTPAANTDGSEAWLASFNYSPEYNLTSDRFCKRVRQVLNASDLTFTSIQVRKDDNNYVYMQCTGATQMMQVFKNVAGAGEVQVGSNVAYNAATMVYWQIREASGSLYFEYSADGETYTELTHIANPFAITAVYPKLDAYVGNVANPGKAIFDDFNYGITGINYKSIDNADADIIVLKALGFNRVRIQIPWAGTQDFNDFLPIAQKFHDAGFYTIFGVTAEISASYTWAQFQTDCTAALDACIGKIDEFQEGNEMDSNCDTGYISPATVRSNQRSLATTLKARLVAAGSNIKLSLATEAGTVASGLGSDCWVAEGKGSYDRITLNMYGGVNIPYDGVFEGAYTDFVPQFLAAFGANAEVTEFNLSGDLTGMQGIPTSVLADETSKILAYLKNIGISDHYFYQYRGERDANNDWAVKLMDGSWLPSWDVLKKRDLNVPTNLLRFAGDFKITAIIPSDKSIMQIGASSDYSFSQKCYLKPKNQNGNNGNHCLANFDLNWGSNLGYALYVTPTNGAFAFLAGQNAYYSDIGVVPYNQDVDISFTITGTTLKVYVNATLVWTQTITRVATGNADVCIGREGAGYNELYGYVKKIAAVKGLWTQTDITNIHNGTYPTTLGMFYKCDEGISFILRDSSGNNNYGKLLKDDWGGETNSLYPTDSGAGSETVSAVSSSVAIPIADSGSGSEVVTEQSSVPIGDSGNGSETVAENVAVPVAESGTGSDIVSEQASVPVGDNGSTKIKYEAENASLSGGAKINTDHPGYSGSGFIDGYWTQGATTTFTVNVPTAGNYDVNLFFSSGGAAATISIYVNGVKIKQTSLSSAGGWNDWGNKAETLSLLSGNNNIAYKYDVGDTGNVNLDYILLDLEQISCSSSIPVADNGSFTDTVSAILNALMIQESVAGSENVSVANIATQKSVVDAGSGTDEAMINVSLSIPENGNANDDTNITVNFSIPDSGNANEVIAITTAILMADEGSAVEALQCLINAALTDGGNGLENLAIKNTLLVNDAASGNDNLLTSISNYINDNVSGNDAISILSAVGVSDSALGEEILHIIASIYINDLGGEKIIDEPCTTTVPVNGIIKEDAVWIDNGNGGSYIKLIPDVNYSYGQLDFDLELPKNFEIDFDFWVGANGAEATFIYFGTSNTPFTEKGTTIAGDPLGGYTLALSDGITAPHPYHINFNGETLAATGIHGVPIFNDNQWHSVKITRSNNILKMILDGIEVISLVDEDRHLDGIKLGVAARSGSVSSEHRVKNFKVIAGGTAVDVTLPVPVSDSGSGNETIENIVNLIVSDTGTSIDDLMIDKIGVMIANILSSLKSQTNIRDADSKNAKIDSTNSIIAKIRAVFKN